MLKFEDAQKRLAKFKVKGREKSLLAAVGKLPGDVKVTGRALLDRDADGKPFKDWEKRNKAREAASVALAKASAKDRERLFGVLFPKLARHVEGGWQLWQRLPYE